MRSITQEVWRKNSLGKILLCLALTLTACTHEQRDGTSQVFYGALQDDAKSLDPVQAYDEVSLEIVPLIYESLYQYSYLEEPYKVVPLLASDYPKLSKDRLTVTIPLRRDVLFQNGRPMVAKDFVYSWNRLLAPQLHSTGRWLFDGKIKDFKALDEHTLQILLIKPYPNLLNVLCMSFTAVLPEEAVKKNADAQGALLDQHVGTGPFLLKKWDHGYRISLEKNPKYHPDFYPEAASPRLKKLGLTADVGKTLPFLDKVHLDVIRETQPTWLNFISGKLDRLTIPKDNLPSAITKDNTLSDELKAKGVQLRIEPTGKFYFVAFNSQDPVLGKNKFLRQAISSAIDRKAWIQLFTQNQGIAADQVLPANIADRLPRSQLKYDFNIARAKELLKKAGYPGGEGLPTLLFDMRGADSLSRQLGDFFRQQLAVVGIKLEIVFNTFPAFLEKARQGNLHMYLGGWILDYPDAENVWQLLYSANRAPGPNDSNYSNPKFDKLYEAIAVMDPGPKRAEIFGQMDALIQEDCPWALGYTVTAFRLAQPWLKNYRYSDLISNSIKYYRIDIGEKKNRLKAQ